MPRRPRSPYSSAGRPFSRLTATVYLLGLLGSLTAMVGFALALALGREPVVPLWVFLASQALISALAFYFRRNVRRDDGDRRSVHQESWERLAVGSEFWPAVETLRGRR